MVREDGIDRRVERARFAHLQALFAEAMNLPPQERQAFIEKACAGDDALVTEINSMLEEDGGPSLLDQDLGALAQQIFGFEGGMNHGQVGAYRLVRMLGEGGMGVVYLAERSDIGNAVAVKFLRDAWLSPARRERFLSEQRLLAPLIHPCIARFYDAGTLEDGVPWFAMEYVDGIPITDYCRQRKRPLEQQLRLFRAVCDAVRYAHDHAVIHRDLKPSNILVKADGSVRLLDFGIAKQIGDFKSGADQTKTLLRLMTPAYAAPEQFRGEPAGVANDVYAVGVILYELLAGRAPFDLEDRPAHETERIVALQEPTRPSLATVDAGLAASRADWSDLDVLCMTAMHKDASRRYRSIEALIRDLDHFLNKEPLEARPDSLPYRTGKFVSRNRRPVLAAAAALLTVIALVAFFLIRLTHARNEALAQAARSDRIKIFMQHLFDGDGQAGPSIELRATDVLDRGVQEARQLEREPRIQGDLFQILGELYEKLGKFDRAHAQLEAALSVRRSAFGEESKEVAQTLVTLGSVHSEQGHNKEALQLIRKASAIENRLLPSGDTALGSCQMALGRVLTSGGAYQEAITVLSSAIPSLSQQQAPTSDLFLALDALGTAYFQNGQFALAESNFQKALALGQRIYTPNNPLIAEELVNLGSVQFSLQHFSAAERYYRSGLDATRAWYGPDYFLVGSESRLLGQALIQMEHYREAKDFLNRALFIHEKLGNLHGDDVQDLNALAIVAQRTGNLREAESYFNRVLEVEDSIDGGKDYVAAMALNNLADLKREERQYARAEALSRKALATVRQVLPPSHLYAGVILLGLGKTLLKEKRFREAEPFLTDSYSILKQQGNPALGTLRKARMALFEDYTSLGKAAEARKLEADLKN